MNLHREGLIEQDNEKYKDGDWYQSDEDGLIWEFGYDIDLNTHRWFLVDSTYYKPKVDQEVETPE